MEENQNTTSEIKKDSGVGPLIGSIIIVIIIVIGGLYYWGYLMDKQKTESINRNEQAVQITDPEIKQINAELENTGLETIDEDLKEIEKEIDSLIQ